MIARMKTDYEKFYDGSWMQESASTGETAQAGGSPGSDSPPPEVEDSRALDLPRESYSGQDGPIHDHELQPFQEDFVERAFEVSTAALSMPRGNGKSWLAAKIVAREFPQIHKSQEIVLAAASIEQCRAVIGFIEDMLGERGPHGRYRYQRSATRSGITRGDGARVRVIGSNGRTAMGLVRCPLVVADEPGAWHSVGGQLLADAIDTAQGKPGSPLRVIYIGTLAPATEGWWHDLVENGSGTDRYVRALRGSDKFFDPEVFETVEQQDEEILRVNPLAAVDMNFHKKLFLERDEALHDARLRTRFLRYRLNCPVHDQETVLLTVDQWDVITHRAVPPAYGRPLVGVDMGQSRAWSAAVAIYPNGRTEAGEERQSSRGHVPKASRRGRSGARGGHESATSEIPRGCHQEAVGQRNRSGVRPVPPGRGGGRVS